MRYHFYKFVLIASCTVKETTADFRFEGVVSAKSLLKAEAFLLEQFKDPYDSISIQSLLECPRHMTYMVHSNLAGTTVTTKNCE